MSLLVHVTVNYVQMMSIPSDVPYTLPKLE